MSDCLPFYYLSDAQLCWLLETNGYDDIRFNSDFSEFIKNSNINSLGKKHSFNYYTEEQFNSMIGNSKANIELSVFHLK